MGRGADVVVGMLGILRASSAYVPLDPQYPAQRLRYLIEDSGVEVVLTQRALRGDLEALGVGVPLVDIETLEAHDAAAPEEEGAAGPARLAYVIYTSGSTGAPKGVEVTHANVLRLLNTTRKQFGFGAEDVWSCFHSTAFDFSVWEIWGALLHGGRLVMVPHWVARAPRAFCELLREQRVSVLNQTPSAFFQLLQQPGFIESAPGWGLKWVIFGGEALDSRRLARWWSHHGGDGGTRFVNMYGITETTVHVTYGEILDPEKAHRSVGDPLGDLRVYLLDASGQPVPPGAAGEIHVGGAGVARGYLGRASLTAERFVPDAFGGGAGARLYRSGDLGRRRRDGTLEYLGRIDQQIKLRGYRIEPGEIAQSLRGCEGVADAHVEVRTGADGDPQLVAYVVLDEGARWQGASALREAMLGRLPAHMVPQQWVRLEAMPLTAHGKLDRRALPAPSRAGETDMSSGRLADTFEERVALLFARILGVPVQGTDQDFFMSGGHSLSATRLLAAIELEFGVRLGVKQLFLGPTIGDIAKNIRATRRAALPPIERQPARPFYPVSHAQRRILLTDQMDALAYVQAYKFEWMGTLDEVAMRAAFEFVTARHEILRTTYHMHEGDYVQVVHAEMPASVSTLVADDDASLDRIADQVLQQALNTPFDLSRGPLLRAVCVRGAAAQHRFCLSMHHIVVDGWSMSLLGNDIARAYRAALRGQTAHAAPPRVQYRDFAAWHNRLIEEGGFDADRDYQRALLREARACRPLPTDVVRPRRPSYRGAIVHDRLSADVVRRLRELATAAHATDFTLTLGLLLCALHEWTGDARFSIGTVASGRHHRDVDETVGFFVNTLTLVCPIDPSWSFVQLLDAVRDRAATAFDHQDYPFNLVVDEAPADSRARTLPFDLLLIVQTIHDEPPEAEAAGDEPQVLACPQEVRRSLFDLKVEVVPIADDWRISIEYATDVYRRETAINLIEKMHRWANTVANAHDVALEKLAHLKSPHYLDEDFDLAI
jgi:amino acid adenylation domain-containing protein